jgi:hypothetical protein
MHDRRILLLSGVALVCVVALAAMGWVLVTRTSTAARPASPVSPSTGPPEAKIVQFYATQPVIPRGGQTSLCYGIEKGVSVRMDPELPAKLDPVAFRCVAVSPDSTTQYELTAVGRDGREVFRSVTISVQ